MSDAENMADRIKALEEEIDIKATVIQAQKAELAAKTAEVNLKGLEVFKAVVAITRELAMEGISKSRKNQQQGYAFRGIDEILNHLSPLLAKHDLCIFPIVQKRSMQERQTQKGGVLFYVLVEVDFHLVSARDGSREIVSMQGEAMDSADKATNKAMSAAYKYMAIQTFAIPTEGDNDADATTHQVAARRQPPPAPSMEHPPIEISEAEQIAFEEFAKDIATTESDDQMKAMTEEYGFQTSHPVVANIIKAHRRTLRSEQR